MRKLKPVRTARGGKGSRRNTLERAQYHVRRNIIRNIHAAAARPAGAPEQKK